MSAAQALLAKLQARRLGEAELRARLLEHVDVVYRAGLEATAAVRRDAVATEEFLRTRKDDSERDREVHGAYLEARAERERALHAYGYAVGVLVREIGRVE